MGPLWLLLFAGEARSAKANEASSVEDDLQRQPSLEVVVARIRAGSPAVEAARARERALLEEAQAERRLDGPALGLEIWQVPFDKPADLSAWGMAMVGIKQRFVPAAQRGALAASKEQLGHAAHWQSVAIERRVEQEASHAYVDYAEAASRHAVHHAHRDLAQEVLATLQGRLRSGGALTEVAQGELELALADAEREGDRGQMVARASRLNTLMGREVDAPLGWPRDSEPVTVTETLSNLLAQGTSHRPETMEATALRRSAEAERDAAGFETSQPTFSLGASYFAPVGPMASHGFGLSAEVELPSVGGKRQALARARLFEADAARRGADAVGREVLVAISDAFARVRAASGRLAILTERARPAAKAAAESAMAVFRAGQGDLVTLRQAQRAVVDVELARVTARSELDHALVDLDWSVGAAVPRVPLKTATSGETSNRSGDAP
jgi:outer membrane protein TolC